MRVAHPAPTVAGFHVRSSTGRFITATGAPSEPSDVSSARTFDDPFSAAHAAGLATFQYGEAFLVVDADTGRVIRERRR